LSTLIDSPIGVSYPIRDWFPLESGARDLAGDFVAHIASVYVLDYPEDVRELAIAGNVLNEMLGRVPLYNYERVKDYFDWPLVDVFELVDCIGLDGLEEVLTWSLSVLEGGALEPAPSDGLIKVFGDCAGWSVEPDDPIDVASLVFLSTIAVYNKTMNFIGE
jgi:hypothetical protein